MLNPEIHKTKVTTFCLDFIQNIDAEHIRGTECDQKILSKKESKGQVGNILFICRNC